METIGETITLEDAQKGTMIKKYCVDNGLTLKTPDLLSIEDLAEMKKLIGA